jgi:hypothetical protein
MRVTKVDVCGKPVSGPNAFVTDCFASIAMNVVTDDQDDITYRAANGALCAVKRGCKTLIGYDIEINIHTWSPELINVLTGNPQVLDFAGDTVGSDDCNIQCNAGFALEFWSNLIEPTCSTTGNARYLYTLLPRISNAYLSDLEIGSEAVTFQLVGTTRAGGQWGVGPYNVVAADAINTPGPMLTPLGTTCHRRMQVVTVPPPVDSCDFVTVPVVP